MQNQQTITINGRQYDALTGLMVDSSTETANLPLETTVSLQQHRAPQPHAVVHAPAQQRSQTLRRRATAKPAPIQQPAKATPVVNTATPAAPKVQTHPSVAVRTRPGRPVSDIRRNPSISRFAPHPVPQQTKSAPQTTDIAPMQHPAAVKVHQQNVQKVAQAAAPRAPKSAAAIKDEAIEHALSQAVRNHKEHKHPRKKTSRWMSIAASSLAVVMLGGYFTYLNMPNLSVRVAAVQAGFDASYPEYKPDGYSLNGPIAAEDGKVSMQFAANSGPQSFTILQEQSNWDSMAVQEHVDKESNNEAITTTVDGLTVYIYGSNASWVNGGVLYTMKGDAPLSSEQIRRIATSM